MVILFQLFKYKVLTASENGAIFNLHKQNGQMVMINKTNVNKVVLSNVFKAMKEANKTGKAHVYNRKGNAYLRVRKCKIDNGGVRFLITDRNNNNVVLPLTDGYHANIKPSLDDDKNSDILKPFAYYIAYDFELTKGWKHA